MSKHKGPMPESVKNFWRIVVAGDLSGEGEDVIDCWEEHLENKPEEDVLSGIYKLSAEDLNEIGEIIAEYRRTREMEEEMREKRRLAEEKNDRIMANFYADKIKKIVMSKPNQFLPKPSATKERGN